ncbi:SpoIIAA-like [Bryocella elongata]|uniref:SpoIIAA-like n=1 Tax=Bryocella elongata TaxID=863522 RepID=A0A1H5RZM0_9BACT|nr:STAS/SEC14 domain-containing protein [Bryocella elongata]SEF43812.1 SpoIIAA-like [Bryocella elongata]
MIEHLQQARGPSFGFTVHGRLTSTDIEDLIAQLDLEVGHDTKPFGVLADLSDMEGADWVARWNEMRFLQRYTDRIARLAIVGTDEWEEISSVLLVATAALQAQTLYFTSSELAHAWHWVKMLRHDQDMPIRMLYPGHGLFENYTPEYMSV